MAGPRSSRERTTFDAFGVCMCIVSSLTWEQTVFIPERQYNDHDSWGLAYNLYADKMIYDLRE